MLITVITSGVFWIISNRPCLPTIALLFFAISPASAQSTWFSGMEHSPSGQAVLNTSLNGESLEITGIGNSGEDGVIVQLADSQFIEFEFDDFNPDILPPGSTLAIESRVQGGTGTLQSFGVITTTVTDSQDLSLSADFSPVGSGTYTAWVLDQGNVVDALPGIVNGGSLAVEGNGDPIGKVGSIYSRVNNGIGGQSEIINICIRILKPPTPAPGPGPSSPTIIFPNGDTAAGDTIMFTPDSPTTAGFTLPTEVALSVSGTPSLTLLGTAQKFNDITVSGTGSAHVESYETTTGTLEVSNIGVSGLNGLAVNTANTFYSEITLSPGTALEPSPNSAIELRTIDEDGDYRGRMRLVADTTAQWEFSADFIGSDTYTMMVVSGGAIVYEESGLTGVGASTTGRAIGFCQSLNVTEGGCVLYGLLDGLYSITTNSGSVVKGNVIQFSNDTPISGCSTELLLEGSNLPPFAVVTIAEDGEINCFNGADDDGDGLIDGDDPDCTCAPINLPTFKRGDANGDGSFDIGDPVMLLSALFSGGEFCPCIDACDANDDGATNIADAIMMLGTLFTGGEPPPAPGPDSCGDDPSSDALGCEEYSGC